MDLQAVRTHPAFVIMAVWSRMAQVQRSLVSQVLGEDREGVLSTVRAASPLILRAWDMLPTWGSDSDLAAELGVCSSLRLIKGHQAPAFS